MSEEKIKKLNDQIESIESRVLEVENHWKITKILAGIFGITAAVLFVFVNHVKSEATEAQDLVKEAKTDALSEIKLAANDGKASIISVENNSKNNIDALAGKLLNGACRTIPRAGSCSSNWVVSCNSDEYIRAVGNHGGSNSCPTNIQCCKVGVN